GCQRAHERGGRTAGGASDRASPSDQGHRGGTPVTSPSPEVTADFHAVISAFPRERRWLLPALQKLQQRFGYLSTDALRAASAHLRVRASEVYGVATDYPELRLHPHGRHHVRVCAGVTCALGGGRTLLDAAERRFGGNSAGVTVEAADCFFECSVAPLIEV